MSNSNQESLKITMIDFVNALDNEQFMFLARAVRQRQSKDRFNEAIKLGYIKQDAKGQYYSAKTLRKIYRSW